MTEREQDVDIPDLVEHVRKTLEPRRVDAEQKLAEAERQLERAKLARERAAHDLATVNRAIANPILLARLAVQFVQALRADRYKLEQFLSTNEDSDLRGLVFSLRWDAEMRAKATANG